MTSPFDLAAFTRHGGALDLARACFPEAPRPWIDLSTGINPVPYPLGTIATEAWTRLPEAGALAGLEAAAAARYGLPPGAAIVAAPGTQAIIQHLPDLCAGDDVRVLGPTYSEYERVFAQVRVRVSATLEALAGADVAIVVNPNNPDGRLVQPEALLVLASRVGMLVVDEAFMDALPHSLVPALPQSRVVVLRSFGKFYGLPGLRLGFAVLAPDMAAALRHRLGPWPVSGPAIAVAGRALRDDAWLAESRARLSLNGARLSFLLRGVGATTVGATPLYQLFAHPTASALFTTLARHGILTRPFDGEPMWLRFGLPEDEAAWARLESALVAFSR